MWIATPAGLGLYAGGTWSKFRPLTAPLHMRKLWPLARIGNELWAGSTGGGLFRLKVGETATPAPRVEMQEPIREEDRTLLQWNSFGYWGSPPASQVETRRRLDGGAWSGWDAKNEASYWSLRPGAHRFEVQAKDSFGNLSKPAALDFLIGFPVYLRPAFLGPLVALLLAGVVLLIRGVTRRRGYIRELRASEARYRGIVEDQTELIGRLSVDGVFTFVNDAFCRYFKQTKERIVGRNCFDSLSEAEANRLRIGLKTLNPDLPFREVIRKMETSTGHPRWQRWVNRAIFDEAGQAVEYQFVGQDITDMHLAQEELAQARVRAESASKAKSEFLATMSHEIRTPMNGIIGMANLMSDTKLDAEQREYAETIRTSADALLVIINEILDLSRIEAGRLVIESAPFDLHRSIQEVVEILSPAAKQKGLSLTLDYPPDAPREFIGDVGRVRQVVLNFAGNSVKFTAAGHVRIAVQCREGAVGGAAEVGISVTDSGIGIPADKLGMLFEKFTQVDASSTRRYQGAGLGLAISKSLVDLMGGSVSVESRIGEGSTFTCHLPLVVHRGERQRVVPTESRSSGVVSVKRPRILVVEDNPVNRLLALRLLEKFGYEATAAGDGQEAIRLWRDGDFSAILMDCRMPEMDGYEAAKEIRSLENGARRIPIISMTANAMDGDREKCLAAGMDDFLAKPIDVEVMRKKLEHWLAAEPQAG